MPGTQFFSVLFALVLIPLFIVTGLPEASAQVNVETMRGEAPTEGWGGTFATSLELSRGNQDLLDVGGTLHVGYQLLYEQDGEEKRRVRRHTFLTTRYRLARQSEETFLHEGFAHLRWTEMWMPRLGGESFLQYQYNEAARLNARALAGGGMRAILVSTGPFDLVAGLGAMVEYERIRVAPGAGDEPETLGVRSTNYVSAVVTLLDGSVRFINTAYVQPLVTNPADLRLLNELQAQLAVTERIAVGLSLRLFYDSRPPTEVEPYDLTLRNSIQVRF